MAQYGVSVITKHLISQRAWAREKQSTLERQWTYVLVVICSTFTVQPSGWRDDLTYDGVHWFDNRAKR